MNGIEIETSDGWRHTIAHVISLGGGRYRASLRLRAESTIAAANFRFEGRPIRGVVKTTVRGPQSHLDTMVIEFQTG